MARPETLIPGNCYFSVHFYDNDLVLPMIDTLVYVGQETDQDEGRLWLFKEPESRPCPSTWSSDGRWLYVGAPVATGKTHAIPVPSGRSLPDLPAEASYGWQAKRAHLAHSATFRSLWRPLWGT